MDKLEYELQLCLNIFKMAGQHKARVTKSRLKGFKEAGLDDPIAYVGS